MKNQYGEKTVGYSRRWKKNRMAHSSGTNSRESEVSGFTEINYGKYKGRPNFDDFYNIADNNKPSGRTRAGWLKKKKNLKEIHRNVANPEMQPGSSESKRLSNDI